jgi:hypothetical protein
MFQPMNRSLPQNISYQMLNLIGRLQDLKIERLNPEISEKLDQIQELVGDLYLSAERNIKTIAADYSFLARDHVFFDGDNDNHSGAV